MISVRTPADPVLVEPPRPVERRLQEHPPRARAGLGMQPAPPIKPAPWKWYIPVYFWIGGTAAGAWVVATAEDVAGEGDRAIIGTARYLSAGALLAGTTLLIADLGRPDRFLNMLRIFRARSAMSLGSWGLSAFGGFVGAGALLQAAEDGLLGHKPRIAAWSAGGPGRVLHLAGLPAALFVGGYTGVLLASTSTPSWARRTRVLGPLFLASGVSSGLAAVTALLELRGYPRDPASRRRRRRALRRLARAETFALGTELALALGSEREAERFPSARTRPAVDRALRGLMLSAGMLVPLARAAGRPARAGLVNAALTLGGSLALRILTTREGYQSARRAEDTWRYTSQSLNEKRRGARPDRHRPG